MYWCSCRETSQILPRLLLSNGPLAGFILQWWATTAADPNRQYTSNISTYSLMPGLFSAFGRISNITSDTSYESYGIIKGLWYYTKFSEKYVRIMRSLFFFSHCDRQLLDKLFCGED